jgi:hypothetical protein
MKMTRLLTELSATLLVISLVAFPGFATTTKSLTIPQLSTTFFTLTLPQGTKMNGSVTPESSVRFFINNPLGNEIVDLGIVNTTTTFAFTATQDGNYTLSFENGQLNSITMWFSYETQPEIPSNASSPTPLSLSELVTIISIVAIIAVLTLSLVLRRQRKKQEMPNSQLLENDRRVFYLAA